MAQQFTELMIRRMTGNGADQIDVWERGKTPGFGVRVSKGGTKTFILLYRHRGRPRRLSLGRWPVVSLATARQKARAALQTLDAGADPAIGHRPDDNPSFRFDAVVKAFVQRHCLQRNRPSTAKETQRLLTTHFVNAWGQRDIRDLRQSDINQVIDRLVEDGRPSEANHAVGVIKTLFSWCFDRDLLDVNPAAKIKKPAKHGKRSRSLSEPELRTLWRAASGEGYPFGAVVQLLILTAQRRGEVAQMQWPQVELNARVWTIPANVSKNGREHVLPLSDAAMEVLQSVPRLNDTFVFPARGNDEAIVSGFTKPKRRLEAAIGADDWTLHDLRRTAATHLARLGTPPHVIERILNHVSGSFAGVAGVYNRHAYIEEMRAALQRWGEWLRRPICVPDEINTTKFTG
jgi:integrase